MLKQKRANKTQVKNLIRQAMEKALNGLEYEELQNLMLCKDWIRDGIIDVLRRFAIDDKTLRTYDRKSHYETLLCQGRVEVAIRDYIVTKFKPTQHWDGKLRQVVNFELLEQPLLSGMITQEGMDFILEQGLLPATYEQLISFAAKYPSEIYVAALGSVARWRRHEYSPYLGYDDGMEFVRRLPGDENWMTEPHRFIGAIKLGNALYQRSSSLRLLAIH